MDDDGDFCSETEHVWGLAEAHLTGRGAQTVSTCVVCGAMKYEPSQAARRPPL